MARPLPGHESKSWPASAEPAEGDVAHDAKSGQGQGGTDAHTTALLEMSAALFASRDAQALASLIAESVCRLAGRRRAAVFEYDVGTDMLTGVASHGISSAGIRAIQEQMQNVPLARSAIRDGVPVRCQDVRAATAIPAAYIERTGLRGVLCIPLIARDVAVGVILLEDAPAPFALTPAVTHRIQSFADMAAMALAGCHQAAAEQEAAIMRERSRLARELHDTVAPAFFDIGMATAALLDEPLSVSVRRRAREIHGLAARGDINVRQALSALASTVAADDLVTALARMIKQYHASAGLKVALTVVEELPSLTPATQETVYAAARELLENVHRHAQATLVTVYLSMQEGCVDLTVSDNGRGRAAQLEAAAILGSRFGLRALRQRLIAAGGDFVVSDNIEGGVAVTARVAPG